MHTGHVKYPRDYKSIICPLRWPWQWCRHKWARRPERGSEERDEGRGESDSTDLRWDVGEIRLVTRSFKAVDNVNVKNLYYQENKVST